MLAANRFALTPTALPADEAQVQLRRSLPIAKLFIAMVILAVMSLQTSGTAFAQDSPPATDGATEVAVAQTAQATQTDAEPEEIGLDKRIDKAFGDATGWFVKGVFAGVPIMEGVSVPWVLFPLVIGAIFFTIVFGFPNIRYFGTAINIVAGKYDELDKSEEPVSTKAASPTTTEDDFASASQPVTNPYKAPQQATDADGVSDAMSESIHEGEVSHFQALTAALSGTVGLGNIAGVAIALSLGGPGATFWMIICGLLGMSSKFVECTLGVTYREIAPNGTVFGGPMYYLSKGFEEKGLGILGKILAVVFAVMCVGGSFGGGNMFQANQAFQLFSYQTGTGAGYGWLFGLVMAVLVGIVIIGGIKSIANVTDKIVPLMVSVYVIAAIFILILHASLIPQAISTIFEGAFYPTAIAGGIVGVVVQGFRRAAFSNEAGIGSASIAHSAVKTRHPASEGLVALLEPFIDTVVVCTMTALVIVISNFDGSVMEYGTNIGNDAQAVVATSKTFGASISWFPWVLMVAVILFAFSTMISWSYYGYQAWSYLFGRSKVQEYLYKGLFCLFVVIGAAASLESVVGFSDAMIFAMLVPNMVGLLFLFPRVRQELRSYFAAIKNAR